jgi:hypothetical protein
VSGETAIAARKEQLKRRPQVNCETGTLHGAQTVAKLIMQLLVEYGNCKFVTEASCSPYRVN